MTQIKAYDAVPKRDGSSAAKGTLLTFFITLSFLLSAGETWAQQATEAELLHPLYGSHRVWPTPTGERVAAERAHPRDAGEERKTHLCHGRRPAAACTGCVGLWQTKPAMQTSGRRMV